MSFIPSLSSFCHVSLSHPFIFFQHLLSLILYQFLYSSLYLLLFLTSRCCFKMLKLPPTQQFVGFVFCEPDSAGSWREATGWSYWKRLEERWRDAPYWDPQEERGRVTLAGWMEAGRNSRLTLLPPPLEVRKGREAARLSMEAAGGRKAPIYSSSSRAGPSMRRPPRMADLCGRQVMCFGTHGIALPPLLC